MTKRSPVVEKRSLSRKGFNPEKLLLVAEDDTLDADERCRLLDRLTGAADAFLCRYGQRELAAWWANRTRFENPSTSKTARAAGDALFPREVA